MKTLITSALPYANGPLHLGHLAGVYLPADILTRHKKLLGKEVLHICGSDEHGVAILKKAQEEKKDCLSYVEYWRKDQIETFKKWSIEFDLYSYTSKTSHHKEAQEWFLELKKQGLLIEKEEEQWFCQSCSQYLPDRFIQGICYSCGYEKARGDECPSCGLWINSSLIKNPECQYCFSKDVILKKEKQYFLKTELKKEELLTWFKNHSSLWRAWVQDYLKSLLKEGFVERAITRNISWGIEVPEEQEKKLYVWFDAPIAYISFLKELGKNWNDYTIIQFLGKDNIIFHGILFPIMCLGMKYKPADILVGSQYLNLYGDKLSKSSGTSLRQELESKYPISYLRYYLITSLPEESDTHFSEEHFLQKTNSDLANTLGNLYSRVLKFYAKKFGTSFTFKRVSQKEFTHFALLENHQFKLALESLLVYVREINQEITLLAPWKLEEGQARLILEKFIPELILIALYLQPFVPEISNKLLNIFQLDSKYYSNPALLEDKNLSLLLPEDFFPRLET